MVDKVGQRYAQAIYEIAQEQNRVVEIYQLLQELNGLYYDNKDFKEFLSHPLVKLDDKLSLIEKIMTEQEEIDKNISLYLVSRGRLGDIKDILEEYKKLYYIEKNIVDVKGIFASELSLEQKESLIKKLENSTKKNVNLEIEVDSTLIGGGILKIGDKVIDGSIKSQLASMAKEQ
ncbi:MAG: ATP synthase F1 subunit delta [Fusobacteriaceae bacterium]